MGFESRASGARRRRKVSFAAAGYAPVSPPRRLFRFCRTSRRLHLLPLRRRGLTAAATCPYFRLLPEDLLHGPALGQLVYQLVQVPDVAHQRVLDLLDPDAADGARDLAGVGIEPRRLVEEGLEVAL